MKTWVGVAALLLAANGVASATDAFEVGYAVVNYTTDGAATVEHQGVLTALIFEPGKPNRASIELKKEIETTGSCTTIQTPPTENEEVEGNVTQSIERRTLHYGWSLKIAIVDTPKGWVLEANASLVDLVGWRKPEGEGCIPDFAELSSTSAIWRVATGAALPLEFRSQDRSKALQITSVRRVVL
jgi:hypothetical protein